MIDWLHELPPVVGAAFVCGCFLVPTLAGSVLFQPMVGRLLRGEKDANTVVGLLLNAFSLYYGVLLALLSIAVLDDYDGAKDAIGQEASSAVALYRSVSGYPEPTRTTLMQTLRRYLDEETGPGWRNQRHGQASAGGMLLMDELGHALSTFKPSREAGEDALHRETVRTFNEFVERRRNRIQAGETSIPPVIWSVVLIGAALNILVLWMFDLRRTTHLLFGGVLAIFIGLVVYMVTALDQPFRGAHGLLPDDLVEARQQMDPR